VFAVPFAVSNRHRSLIRWNLVDDVYHPRSVLYFSDQHQAIAPTYLAVAQAVDRLNCRNVAVDSYLPHPALRHSPISLYVYPLLALIHADGRTRRVWYTGVNNLTAKYSVQDVHSAPCAVICLDCARVWPKWDDYRSVGGRASVFDNIVIFSANGNNPNSDARVPETR
jgi:hypothetical protein